MLPIQMVLGFLRANVTVAELNGAPIFGLLKWRRIGAFLEQADKLSRNVAGIGLDIGLSAQVGFATAGFSVREGSNSNAVNS